MTTPAQRKSPEDVVSLRNRGLAYGDGLFETIAVRGGKARFVERHRARLLTGLMRLGIDPGCVDGLEPRIAAFLGSRSRTGHGVLKLFVTRPAGERGYRPPERGRPRLRMHYDESEPTAAATISLGVATLRLARQPRLAGMKHLNRLEQVLAAREAMASHYDDLLILDSEGFVVCATAANLFFVSSDVLHTPAMTHAGIIGVMRELVVEAAGAENIELDCGEYRLSDFLASDEIYISNTLTGLRSVSSLLGGPRSAGPVFRKLCQRLTALGVEECAHS